MRGTSCLLLRFTVAGIGDVCCCEMKAASAAAGRALTASGKSAPGLKRENCDSDLLWLSGGRYGQRCTAFRIRLIPDPGSAKRGIKFSK